MNETSCSEVEAIAIYNSAIDPTIKKIPNLRIEILKGIVSRMSEFRSSDDLFAIAKSREEKVINKNLTFWQAICDSLWLLHQKRHGQIAIDSTVNTPQGKPNLRIHIVMCLANNIEEFGSADEMFAVPCSRNEKGITQNLNFWREICDSLWFVYYEEI